MLPQITKRNITIAIMCATALSGAYYLFLGINHLIEYSNFVAIRDGFSFGSPEVWDYLESKFDIGLMESAVGIIFALTSITTLYFGFIRPYMKRKEIK